MNREQRRAVKKAIKQGKVDINKVQQAMLDLAELHSSTYGISEGDKVKLDYEKITSDPNYDNMNPDWKAWIDEHKDQELTVDFSERQNKNKLFCEFLEDTNEVKWLFFVGDLIKIS